MGQETPPRLTAEQARKLVQELVETARRKLGSGPNLLHALEEAGYEPPGESAVSKWANGGVMPGAEVFLLLADAAELSVDQLMRRQALEDRITAIEVERAEYREAIESLRQELARVREELKRSDPGT